ncbi:hypothetical protein QUF72_09195, partial [Desulfobacterales bacterium HSG2]|nr:hypothetical protein [Desulfobacterales bacterium HSG2]
GNTEKMGHLFGVDPAAIAAKVGKYPPFRLIGMTGWDRWDTPTISICLLRQDWQIRRDGSDLSIRTEQIVNYRE